MAVMVRLRGQSYGPARMIGIIAASWEESGRHDMHESTGLGTLGWLWCRGGLLAGARAAVVPIVFLGTVWGPVLGRTDSVEDDRAQAGATPLPSGPLADPVLQADAVLEAGRALSWTDGAARMVLLERGALVAVGTYGFRANRALVRIETQPRPGHALIHLTAYLDAARPLQGRGAVQAQAPRLLVTASTTGRVRLETDLLRPVDLTPQDPFVTEAIDRIKRHRDAVMSKPLDVPVGGALFGPDAMRLQAARRQQIASEVLRETRADLASVASADTTSQPPSPLLSRPIMASGGSVAFHAEKIVFQDGGQHEGTVALLGSVRVMYQHPGREQVMSLRAENAVIFLAPDAMKRLSGRQADSGDVRGVYLEENVEATDGQYTVRAPRVYYDLTLNKAVVLDAVFYTWDAHHRVPIYVRAKRLRQESLADWSAQQATLTTSEFAQPHFSIGANHLRFRRQSNPDGTSGYRFTARDTTMRVGQLPVFYWPYLAGDAQALKETVLPRVSVSYSQHDGANVRTTWNMFAVTGQPDPEGVKLRGRADYLGDRGPAAGLNLEYGVPGIQGSLDGYVVFRDEAEDEIASRKDLQFDGDTRGYTLWRHRQRLRDHWELSLEVSHVSDETFLEEFFLSEAEVSKPYETSLYLKKQHDDWALTFLAQSHTMAFTPQTTALQSPGYTVEKTPEIGYHRIGTSLWGNRLTYMTESRLGRVRIRSGEDSPSTRGFTPAQSADLFGLAPVTTFEDAARVAGIPGNYRLRLDSRHEIQSPLKMDVFDIVPYITGRVTLYDDDFDEFSGQDDRLRLWTTVGLRVHTQFSRTYDQVQSRVLDLYRLRHVIEPRLDVFWSGSTINPEDIPVYDTDVESLSEGYGVRVGGRQILQTQRGGPGRWRSVDWLVVGTELVLRGDDTDVDRQIARFFSYRPEFSVGGDHFHSDLAWMLSDTLAAVGELTYNLEDSFVSHWRLGWTMRHGQRLSFFTDYAEIDGLSSRLWTYGFHYELTRKYRIYYRHTLDLGENESRTIAVTLERKLPRWRLQVVARIDELDDEQSFGFVLVPEGMQAAGPIQLTDSR